MKWEIVWLDFFCCLAKQYLQIILDWVSFNKAWIKICLMVQSGKEEKLDAIINKRIHSKQQEAPKIYFPVNFQFQLSNWKILFAMCENQNFRQIFGKSNSSFGHNNKWGYEVVLYWFLFDAFFNYSNVMKDVMLEMGVSRYRGLLKKNLLWNSSVPI